jgi:hypothetical protein
MTLVDAFRGVVYVFLGLGTLWVVGLVIEHILFDI